MVRLDDFEFETAKALKVSRSGMTEVHGDFASRVWVRASQGCYRQQTGEISKAPFEVGKRSKIRD